MIELLTTAQIADADRIAIGSGVPGITLMENAGRAVADRVTQRHPPGSRIVVVAGPGNNGGDGFVAARLLAARGYHGRVLLVGSRERLRGDAAVAAKQWTGAVEAPDCGTLRGADCIIDSVFGAGLDRPVTGVPRQIIEAMNAADAPVIAVDLPSGINGNTGAVMGVAVRARETVTFFRRKPGHLLLPGRLHCGPVTVADIGIPESVFSTVHVDILVNRPELWGAHFPVPRINAHKYTRGHAVIVSGDVSHTGAARLAARGALRAGAGLVTIASPRDALAVNASATTAIMIRPVDGSGELAGLLTDRRINAVVLGPGGGVGEGTRTMALAALATESAVVLDADALTSFSDQPEILFTAIAQRAPASTVLTPHEGEFSRLFSELQQQDLAKASKLDRARRAAKHSGAIVVLKGPDSVVAAPDGLAAIAENAPPWLATAGSGDVLAGFVAGLLAQGMPAFRAVAAAVWLHGEAAKEVGPGLIAEDLPEILPAIYRRLFNAGSTLMP